MVNSLEKKCIEKGLKMTGQRKVIAEVIAKATDHPDVEEVYARASKLDKTIGIATVYRTVRLFEENGIIEKHDFGDGRARYETAHDDSHHDHIINVKTREIIEFYDEELEKMKNKIAEKHGYKLIGHKLELYVTPKK